MAETVAATTRRDLRDWTPEVRRKYSLIVLFAAVVVVAAGAFLYGFVPENAGWPLVAGIVVLGLLLAFEVAIVATGVAREKETGPAWLQGGAAAGSAARGPQAAGAPSGGGQMDLKCPECSNIFSVQDTGVRPLLTTCPHCGAQGHVDESPTRATATTTAQAPPDSGIVISLKCPACGTQFSVEDKGERPLRAACPGCGRAGRLK